MAFDKELMVERLSGDPWFILYHPIRQDADARLLEAIRAGAIVPGMPLGIGRHLNLRLTVALHKPVVYG
jgi:hypothetical protein